jgi:hypothetical protein
MGRLTAAGEMLYCRFPNTPNEDNMAKKSATAKKATATPKAAAKKGCKSATCKSHEADELVLDAVEEKAFDLAQSSDALCDELEVEVTEALSVVVRKVYKKHKIALSAQQAKNVALVLFGD